MIPVLDAEQMRLADRFCIEHTPILSIDLMERAANACAVWIKVHEADLHPSLLRPRYLIVCGTGNNGGDGLAIARLLHADAREVRVVVIGALPGSPDFRSNLGRLKPVLQSDALIIVNSAADLPTVLPGTIVLDALFGTGLNRALDGLAQKAVNWMNRSNAPVVAIDLPSGLFADGSVMDPNGIVQAQHTLTFHCPKPAFYYRECAQFLGEWTVLDIGLDDAFIDRLNSEYKEVGSDDVRRLLPAFHRFAHKGDHGHVLLIAGSEGMMGAAALAVMSALRSGVGLVTVHIPKIGLQVLQSLAPEALCSVDNGEARIADLPDLSRCSAVGIGPGMGAGSASVVELLIQKARMPLVLDADALNALAENKTWLANLPKGTVLTPHPKEFDRLFGAHSSGRERIATAKDEARKRAIVIVMKGAYTAICAASGQVFFNPTGDPGMAKGGSGDVLTGLITGLLARGLQPLEAALLGTYVHGTAGTLAAVHVGRDGMTAIDIVHHLPMAWRELRRGASENAVQ